MSKEKTLPNENTIMGTIYKEDDNGVITTSSVTFGDMLLMFANKDEIIKNGGDDALLFKEVLREVISIYEDENIKKGEVLDYDISNLKDLYNYLCSTLAETYDFVDTPAELTAKIDTSIKFDDEFSTILQGTATNKFSHIRPLENGANQNMYIDAVGSATISDEDFAISITGYDQLKGLDQQTQKLLDILVLYFTNNSGNPRISFKVTDYMELRGLKDIKEAKKQLADSARVLAKTTLSWTENTGNKKLPIADMNILDSWAWVDGKRTTVNFNFAPTFANQLHRYYPMPYPISLLKTNSHKNPNSTSLGRKIAEHKNMNWGKPNEDIISVKTLLKCAPYLPSYEDVKKSRGSYQQKIIDRFERDLDVLNKTFSWHYCDTKGKELTEKQLSFASFEVFEETNIKINWHNYPDEVQIEKLKKRAEDIKKAEQTRRKRK